MNSAWSVCLRQLFKEGFLEEERADVKINEYVGVRAAVSGVAQSQT